METIKVPEGELSEMKQFYQDEFERTSRRLEHIRAMLENLDIDPESMEPVPYQQKPAASGKTAPSKPSKRSRKRSGRKSKWELLIMKRMRQLDKPVTYDELTDEIMTFSKLPPEKRESTKQAIVNVIFRLRNRDGKLDTFSIGTREKYIALKGWFDEPGVIRKEYAAKIERPEAKKKIRKSTTRRKKAAA